MTSPDLDRRLRAADPYQSADLDGADTALLEEILRQSPVDPVIRLRARRIRRGRVTLKSRLAISLATAAAVTAAIAVPVLITGQDAGAPPQAGGAPATGAETVTPVRYAAAAVKVAKANPRVLVTAPGWKVRSLGGFSATSGEMTFQHGPDRYRKEPVYGHRMTEADKQAMAKGENPSLGSSGPEEIVGHSRVNDAPHLSVDWYPRESYGGYLGDRSDQPGSRWVTVDGKRARLVNYAADDHAVLMAPQGGVFLELRGSGLGDEAAFLKFLAEHVEQVDVPTWLAALPSEMVVAGGAQQAVTRILADIPVPPGFERDDVLGDAQALDSYQLGATVTGAVACGWIEEWERARAAGDEAGAERAADQLATSHDWTVLHEMDAEGDYPEAIWEYADRMAAGQELDGVREGLGCPGADYSVAKPKLPR